MEDSNNISRSSNQVDLRMKLGSMDMDIRRIAHRSIRHLSVSDHLWVIKRGGGGIIHAAACPNHVRKMIS